MKDIRGWVNSYLDDAEDNLESDDFLVGQDVTFEQAKDLLEDFAKYVETVSKTKE